MSTIETQQEQAQSRYQKRSGARDNWMQQLKTKDPFAVDDPERVANRKALLDARDGLALERIIGTSDLFPISHLEMGLQVGKAICRIEIRDSIGRVRGYGTGFLVSPVLLLTNNHVLPDKDTARFSLAQFNHETDLQMLPCPIRSFRLDPDRFFITDEGLDFTLVAVEESSADGIKLEDFGFLRFLKKSGKALLGEYVTIIQHPSGGPKAVAFRENQVKDIFEDFIHYATDTEPGSSGAAVLNDEWQVVALHHSGVRDPNDSTKWVANEGIRASSIMKFLDTEREGLNMEDNLLLADLFGEPATKSVRSLKKKRIEVSELPQEWYEGSTGYDIAFLGDAYQVPLPELRPDLKKDIAPLKDGGSVLKYTHFSIVTSKSRRLAYYTAVNIDGSQLKSIIRDEDNWHFDPRMSQKYQSGPDLYSKNDLDRGHLVRRIAPVWGDKAAEANEDTFHFTNCAPQHLKLNRKPWQNLEDYILKNAGRYDIKVTVFTGPIFRDDDLLYRGKFQVPAEYWKVVVMVKDDGKLSATAYLQTQKNLLEDLEFAYGQYKTYQIPVARVQHLTGIDFGELVKHDPIADIETTVGQLIEKSGDIRL